MENKTSGDVRPEVQKIDDIEDAIKEKIDKKIDGNMPPKVKRDVDERIRRRINEEDGLGEPYDPNTRVD